MTVCSLIIPCYNEEETIEQLFVAAEKVRAQLQIDFEYIFVNDGSTDQTLQILRKLQAGQPDQVHYLSFSRNFGKEAAIFAGLKEAKGDLVTLLDADLQDPPELLIEMYERIQEEEVDCVAARRTDRSGESWVISAFSRTFYRLMNRMSDTPIVDGVRDFRLMTRQMVDAILELSEYNRFSKGIFSWVGFNTVYVTYANHERVAGRTKWSFWSKVRYAISGFVNFSEAPLRLAAYTGLFVVICDILAIIILVIRQLVFRNSVSGWTSMIVIILMCFGITMLTIGIIGMYLSNIFLEIKKRPIYIIKEKK